MLLRSLHLKKYQQQPRLNKYGVAKPMTDGDIFQLEDVIEKPAIEEAPSNLAIAARYVFSV